MIREKLVEKGLGQGRGARWRNTEVSRIEGLSDAVFGFAITLLVVSLEVPRTFGELIQAMRGFGAFAVCFALLFVVWFNHYKFFRRYGLQDNYVVWVNAFLLFVVLFYVYPLKFVFTSLLGRFTGHAGRVLPDGTYVPMVRTADEATDLMIIFGAGYVAVFFAFLLLYFHAYRKRSQLELNELEIFDTRNELQEIGINMAIGLLSITIAVVGRPRMAGLSGMTYMLIGPLMAVHGFIMGSRRQKLAKQFDPAPEPT